MRLKILAAIYVLVLAVIIFLANGSQTQHLFRFVRELPFGDKAGHFLLMGMFSLVLNLALGARAIKLGRLNLPLGTLIVLIVVTLEEFSQIFVRSRTFDKVDLLFDYAGILLFGAAANWLTKTTKV